MTLDYSALANAILPLEKSLAYAHSAAALAELANTNAAFEASTSAAFRAIIARDKVVVQSASSH